MADAASFLEMLRRDGWVRHAEARLTPLTGGVSSEIYLVEDGAEKFVVKRALAKLRVKDDWFADIGRNAAEREYIACVGRIQPGVVPRLRFAHDQEGYFGMEFLGDGFANWKELLLRGDARPAHARQAGTILGEIHRRTRGDEALRKRFETTANFRELRLKPYLLTTGERHPELRAFFTAEAARIEATRECLVHGDFSPKNILIKGDRMVLLDCEVAWFGDPAFDAAFFLNHLFLKWLRHAPDGIGMEAMIVQFWQSYLAASGSAEAEFEPRVLRLLPLLMLARVDGKSPVEYLDPVGQDVIRRMVPGMLRAGRLELAPLMDEWAAACGRLQPNGKTK